MSLHQQNIGHIGEDLATDFLRQKGYRIVERNYYCHWGEIDLIAEHDGILVFIEVKTRTGDSKGKPYEAVDFRKIKHLKRPVEYYLLEKKASKRKCRFDVIAIILNPQLLAEDIQHYENVEIFR